MGNGRQANVWNGRTMGEGLSAGRLDVRVQMGELVSMERSALRPVVLRDVADDGRVRVRLVGHRRVASVTLREVPAERPVLGAPGAWSPSLVEARLRRAAGVFRAMPGASDIWPAGYRSCMPQPVREIFHDMPAEPRRVRPARDEIDLATATYEWQLDVLFDPDDSTRFALAEAVAHGIPWRKVSKRLRSRADCRSLSDHGAKNSALRVLAELAAAWTHAGRDFDEVDIRLAESLSAAGRSVIP